MERIKLKSLSDKIENAGFKETYLEKLYYLERTLKYLDKVGIDATITLKYDHTHERITTWVDIACDDEGFKKILILVTEGFNTYPEAN